MRTDNKEMVVEKIRAQYEEKSAEEKKLYADCILNLSEEE